ncbi:MAG: DUF1800 domain-containing protein [Phycisphaerales bacterium]
MSQLSTAVTAESTPPPNSGPKEGSGQSAVERRGGLSRRRAMSRAALAAFAGLGAAAERWAAASPPSVSADVDPSSLLRKLVNRITFGFTESEFALAQSLGYSGYLEHHLNLGEDGEDPAVAAAIAGSAPPTTGLFPWINASNGAIREQAVNVAAGPVTASVTDATIFRQVFSRRQLHERMVEFWSDHFNIDINIDSCTWLKLLDDRSVIRPNAMTSFEQLLNASARSAAMLNYLDNDVSRVGALNENYGRELLELHSVSVLAGYTQQDVIEVSRCLTGWTWWSRNPPTADDYGTFRYNATLHDNGSKTLSPLFNLNNPGQPLVIPANGGQNDAQTVLSILAAHPSTAGFIARKLCTRFIGEDCPQKVVDAVAAAYLSTTPKGDVKTMLRTMLDPNVLADATPRIKRPVQLFASAMRSILPGTGNITAFATLKNQYRSAGQLHFNWSPPDGYPDTNEYWTGLLLPRWNFVASMMTNGGGSNGGINGITVDAAAVNAFFPAQTLRDQVIAKINQSLFGGAWPAAEQNAVRSFLPTSTLTLTQKRDALSLSLSSPSFQYI